jgi:hypothetical protein
MARRTLSAMAAGTPEAWLTSQNTGSGAGVELVDGRQIVGFVEAFVLHRARHANDGRTTKSSLRIGCKLNVGAEVDRRLEGNACGTTHRQ